MKEQKRCPKCGESKKITDFAIASIRGDKRQAYCRTCSNKIGRENYLKNKERYIKVAKNRDKELDKLIISFKDRPCADCGVKYPPFVMDFDHLGNKKFGICYMRRHRMAFSKIIEEIKKCEVVCSNCHRLRTNSRNPARWLK